MPCSIGVSDRDCEAITRAVHYDGLFWNRMRREG